jgi:Ca2+-binding EF-hand superfamily protein
MKHLGWTTAMAVAMGMAVSSVYAQETNTTTTAAASQSQTGSITCDNWYGRVDVDSNGYISQDEQRNHVDSAFKALDKDGDGQVSQAEYNDCFVKPNSMSVEADRTQENFGDIDANSDKALDMGEFRSSSQDAFRQMKSADASNQDDPKFLVIRRYIFLTPQEVSQPQNMQGFSDDEAAARAATTFALLDADGDGKVTVEEWTNNSPSYSEERAKKRFQQLDADSSSTLSKDEYQKNMSGMTAQSGQQETNQQTSEQGVPAYDYRFNAP